MSARQMPISSHIPGDGAASAAGKASHFPANGNVLLTALAAMLFSAIAASTVQSTLTGPCIVVAPLTSRFSSQ